MSRIEDEAHYWRIEAAAELVRLPPRRIRRYLREGLIQPARREGRTILLGESELARLRKIRRLHDDLGLNIAGIAVALRLLAQIEAIRAANEPRILDAGVLEAGD